LENGRNPSTLPKLIAYRNKILRRLERLECNYLYTIDTERVAIKQIIKQRSFKKPQDVENNLTPEMSQQDPEKEHTLAMSPASTFHDELTKRPSFISHATIPLESEVLSSGIDYPLVLTKNVKRPSMVSIGSWNPLHRVDAISTLRELYLELNRDIKAIQQSVLSEDPAGCSAFITFNTQAGAQIAVQTLTAHTPMKLQERKVNVSSNDVIWSSLEIDVKERMVRSLAGNALSVALNIFWCAIGKST
jgi:Cytosolic domain of 10TM putative phosphate transporter